MIYKHNTNTLLFILVFLFRNTDSEDTGILVNPTILVDIHGEAVDDIALSGVHFVGVGIHAGHDVDDIVVVSAGEADFNTGFLRISWALHKFLTGVEDATEEGVFGSVGVVLEGVGNSVEKFHDSWIDR